MIALASDYTSSIQIVGLGGTGANVIESFVQNHDNLLPLLKIDGIKISLLALDVADHDIRSLDMAYKNLSDALKTNGIPADKIHLESKTMKFPTPESMFDFIKAYPDFLEREGAVVPEHYTPWLSSSMEIPPLAGGVGRKRALSKAIYGLNYHHLKLVDGYMDKFKEHVFTATIQPIIFLIYGLGGGSGSGTALDFARHLRKKIGSGIPIIGLAILPCSGDDPPAKGASCYSSLLEHEYAIDRSLNHNIVSAYGEPYKNPFTAFLMMSLGPAYSRTGSVLDARKLVDEAIVDILMKSLNFDLADLFSNIGSNVDLGGKWVNVISTLKVSYPVAEFIELTKIYLDKLDRLRELRKEKLEIYSGNEQSKGLIDVMNSSYNELKAVYRGLSIEKNTYEESRFEENVQSFLGEGVSMEAELLMHIRGAETATRTLVNDLSRSVLSIGLDAADGTVEARIRTLSEELVSLSSNLSQNYNTLQDKVKQLTEDLRNTLPSAQKLTPRQSQIITDTINLVELIDQYLTGLQLYLNISNLADKLNKALDKSEKTELHKRMKIAVERISNPELVINFALLSSLLSPVETEVKTLDARLGDCQVMKRLTTERTEELKVEEENLTIKKRSREQEKGRVGGQAKKIRFGFLGPKKKYMQGKASDLEHELNIINSQLTAITEERQTIQSKLSAYQNIERKFEVASSYRKLLTEASTLQNTYYEKMNESMRDRGYYDRVAELTEGEQLKIMQRILLEDEASLTQENMLNEIIDRQHLKEYLSGALGIFRIPATMGLTADYRTDYLWFTVVSPRGLWDKDLSDEAKTMLSGYVKQDASKSIYIREVDSTDPWTMRFLIIAAKASVKDLETFKEMDILYNQTTRGERLLSHSYLLEQGVHVSSDHELKSTSRIEDTSS